MFSFHKPKIYRSLRGCCICRAKSSSSRFTDSKRYEADFYKCFLIVEERKGEICNACVLLVKRWKKLKPGVVKDWSHVVDARAGPGTKSMNKIKNKAKMEAKLLKKKHRHKHRKPTNKAATSTLTKAAEGLSDDVLDNYSDLSSQSGAGFLSERSDDEGSTHSRAKGKSGRKSASPLQYSSFIDLSYYKRTEVCCGVVFIGPNNDVLIDQSLFHPCSKCQSPVSDGSVVSAASAPRETCGADIGYGDENDLDAMLGAIDDDEVMAMIGGKIEDDDGTDSGLGSQSTAEGSPHPGPHLQTAEAVFHAMSTGTGLNTVLSSGDKSPNTESRSRYCSGEQSSPPSPTLNTHSITASSVAVPPEHGLHMQMEF